MARVSTYLNFVGKTEEAFLFYRDVFQTEFLETMGVAIMKIKDAPADPNMPPMSEADLNCVMHVELPITAGHVLMGTDFLESMGQMRSLGNNVSINLEPDTREETARLFDLLSVDGSEVMPLEDMFWGALFGTCVDRFGTRWMFNGPAA